VDWIFILFKKDREFITMQKKKLPKWMKPKPKETVESVRRKETLMDIVYSLNPPRKRLSFFSWLNRYL